MDQISFDFPYGEYVAQAFVVLPSVLAEVEGSDQLSDFAIAKQALTTFRRLAPQWDSNKGLPWLVFAELVFKKDLRTLIKAGEFVAPEETALALFDAVMDADGGR